MNASAPAMAIAAAVAQAMAGTLVPVRAGRWWRPR
jgi:hypothetical protein